MYNPSVFFIVVFLAVMFFVGTPDLLDAIIGYVTALTKVCP
jgi:hypothetical protein